MYGYPEQPEYETFYDYYQRSGIAGVIVDKVCKSCWRDVPKIIVNDSPVLEDELNQLIEKGLFKFLERADILNRIGRYSALFIGVNDGSTDLKDEIQGSGDIDSLYFQVYGENNIKISDYDTEVSSARFPIHLVLGC